MCPNPRRASFSGIQTPSSKCRRRSRSMENIVEKLEFKDIFEDFDEFLDDHPIPKISTPRVQRRISHRDEETKKIGDPVKLKLSLLADRILTSVKDGSILTDLVRKKINQAPEPKLVWLDLSDAESVEEDPLKHDPDGVDFARSVVSKVALELNSESLNARLFNDLLEDVDDESWSNSRFCKDLSMSDKSSIVDDNNNLSGNLISLNID